MPTMTIEQAFELAVREHQAGRLPEAENIYRQILARHPNHAEANNNLGIIAHQTGHSAAAVDFFRRAIALRPDYADAFCNLGDALRQVGQLDAAVDACRQSITLQPTSAEAHLNLGAALLQKGQVNDARVALHRVLILSPNSAKAHFHLGLTQKAAEKLDDAIASYRQALAFNPQFAEAYFNLGNIFFSLGKHSEAITALEQAVRIKPNWIEPQNNLGVVLQASGQYDRAIDAYRRAITIDPKSAEPYRNLGNTLRELGELDEAIGLLRQGLSLAPNAADAHSNLILTLQYHSNLESNAIRDEQENWDRLHARPMQKFVAAHGNDRNPDRRLRIGYVSPDFRDHVVGKFIEPLLANHDHERFEIFCYCDATWPDEMTTRLLSLADHWLDVSRKSDEQILPQIRTDAIDILVDLAGHTGNNRLQLFARKPSPVQVSYLGYPGPTGLSAIDYRLSDPLADPSPSDSVFLLPKTNWCFTAPAEAPAVQPPPAMRQGCVTFGSFNNLAKVTDPMLDLWSRILLAVPNSRLLLKAAGFTSARAVERITKAFAARGIEANRLILRARETALGDHLSLYAQMDIALDTFPYNGTSTTCDALWMGVPVVTLAGKTHVSRVGLSLLTNIGLPELIAAEPDQYVRIATDLAGNPERLASLRQSMRDRMRASPLMDAANFARDVESAYRRTWQTWCATGSLSR